MIFNDQSSRSGKSVYIDVSQVEAATFEWTDRSDYGSTIYNATIYMKSGNSITASVRAEVKDKIEKIYSKGEKDGS